MSEQFKAGDRVKFFEPRVKILERGTIENFFGGDRKTWISIRLDGFDGKVSTSTERINGRWFAFSVYSHKYELRVYPENRLLPIPWTKDLFQKISYEILELKWAFSAC